MRFRYAERASAAYGWSLYPIADAGHLPFVEQPEAFESALRAALEGWEGRGPPGRPEVQEVD